MMRNDLTKSWRWNPYDGYIPGRDHRFAALSSCIPRNPAFQGVTCRIVRRMTVAVESIVAAAWTCGASLRKLWQSMFTVSN